MNRILLEVMIEDILNANVVQLNDEFICLCSKINQHRLFFTVFRKEKVFKKRLRFQEIVDIFHVDIGKWKIVTKNVISN